MEAETGKEVSPGGGEPCTGRRLFASCLGSSPGPRPVLIWPSGAPKTARDCLSQHRSQVEGGREGENDVLTSTNGGKGTSEKEETEKMWLRT